MMMLIHKKHEISSEMEVIFIFYRKHYVIATQAKPEYRKLNKIPDM